MKKLLFVAVLVWGTTTHAHDPMHYPQMVQADRDWFNSLTNRKGGACCSNADGFSLEPDDWEIVGDKHRVKLYGAWHDVPPEALVDVPNRANVPWVWPRSNNSGGITILCFMPGVQG